MNRPNPVQRFLGIAPGDDSPFSILGVSRQACDEREVREALRRRLERLARHPEAFSHEADEVRLALHAAAAQLLDEDVRSRLSSRDAGAVGAPGDEGRRAFRQVVRRILARSGGWTRESQRWLALFSRAYGLDDAALRDELSRIARDRSGAGALPAAPPPMAEARPTRTIYEEIRAGSRPPRAGYPYLPMTLISLITLVVVVAGLLLLRESASPPATPEASQREPASAAPGAPDPASVPSDAPPSPNGEAPSEVQLRSPEAIIRWLELAHEDFDADPGGAAWRFERATAGLSRAWLSMNDAARRRAGQLTLAFLHRVDHRVPSGQRALDAVSEPLEALSNRAAPLDAPQMAAALWSAATLADVSDERDLDGAVRARAQRHLAPYVDMGRRAVNGLTEGLAVAAPPIGQALVAALAADRRPITADAWRTWLDALDLVALELADDAREASERRDRMALNAAESLLRSAASPATRAESHEALTLMLERVRWARDGADPPAAWRRFLSWFDAPEISSADLAVATEWVVAHSHAPAVGPGMTLSRAATMDSRDSMRRRYARSWRIEDHAETVGFATVWLRQMQDDLRAYPTSGDLGAALGRAALLSRFSEAASLRWTGRIAASSSTLINARSSVRAALESRDTPLGAIRDADPERDGDWAVEFLGAGERAAEARVLLLAQLGRRPGPLGPVDADVLVMAALRMPSSDGRARAQEVVRRRASEPGVVAALLDAMPGAPRTASTRALVMDVTGTRLPEPHETDYPLRIREALIERLLEMLAPDDEAARIDRVAGLMAQSYAVRAASGEGSENGADGVTSAAADEDVFGALTAMWRRCAEPLAPNQRAPHDLDELDRRRDGRQRIARTSIQRFAVEQLNAVEVMAYVVSGERPSRATDVRAVLGRMRDAQRSAGHLVEQLIAGERAMLEMWMIRYGVDPMELDAVGGPARIGGGA